MAKQIEHLNLNIIGLLREEGQQNYVDDNLFISMSVVEFQQKNLRVGQPYRIENGRAVCVTNGWSHCIINLEEHRLTEHAIVVIPPGSLFEILEYSPDFDMMAMSLKDLPVMHHFGSNLIIHADADEWLLIQEYFALLWHETKRQPLQAELVRHLQTAMLMEMERIGSRQVKQRLDRITRQERMLHDFIAYVNQYGTQERKIEFYADKLCVTPNHLGTVIKRASGLTVMQWLNRHAIQQAKVLLRYSDLPIWEVAERMNFANPSFFSKFFKGETGMTPGEYRSGK